MGFYFDSLLIDFTAVLALIITSIFFYFKYSFQYWEFKGVPYIKPIFPYGNVKNIVHRKENFGLNVSAKYRELRKQGADYGGFYLFTRPVFMPLDPNLLKIILTKEFNKFHDRGIYSNESVDPLSAHLFASRGNKWKSLRNKLSPTFTSGKMKMMFQTLVSCSEGLDKILEEPSLKGNPVGIKDLIARFTTDVIGSCVFGLECNSLNNPHTDFRKYGQKVISTTLSNSWKLVLGFVMPGLFKYLKIRQTDSDVENFFLTVLRDNIHYREKNDIHRKDFMELFIRLKNNENIQDENLITESKFSKYNSNDGITFYELAAQAFVFFIAGYEAPSSTSSICLLELAQNMEIQNKVRDEIKTVLKKYNGELTYEAIMDMKYMDQVVSETLRKYPIAPNLIRECNEDFQLPDSPLILKKGTSVWISIMGMHMDPEYYPNPEKFDPDRFTEEEKAKRHSYSYIPFGEGPRTCIGMRFALLQTKVALAVLLRNHKFTVSPKTQIPLEWSTSGLLLFPKSEIWLQPTKIN